MTTHRKTTKTGKKKSTVREQGKINNKRQRETEKSRTSLRQQRQQQRDEKHLNTDQVDHTSLEQRRQLVEERRLRQKANRLKARVDREQEQQKQAKDKTLQEFIKLEQKRQQIVELGELQLKIPNDRMETTRQLVNPLLLQVTNQLTTSTNLQQQLIQWRDYLAMDAPANLTTHITDIDEVRKKITTAQQTLTQHSQALQPLNLPSPGELYNILKYANTISEEIADNDTKLQDATNFIANLQTVHGTGLAARATYKNLNLTHAVVEDANGPINKFSLASLTRLNTLIQGAKVTNWDLQRWPRTRDGVGNIAGGTQVLMPHIEIGVSNTSWGNGNKIQLMIGPEIIVDWLIQNADHGLPYSKLFDIVQSILDLNSRINQMFPLEMEQDPNRNNNWATQNRNYAFRLILNPDRTMIISYFNT